MCPVRSVTYESGRSAGRVRAVTQVSGRPNRVNFNGRAGQLWRFKRPCQATTGPVTGKSRNVAMALTERSELGQIEFDILHGIMPTIASPQLQIMNRRCRRNQRVSQFNAVALSELSQILSSLPSNLQVDGHTLNR
jgi:hypothetical protein